MVLNWTHIRNFQPQVADQVCENLNHLFERIQSEVLHFSKLPIDLPGS